MSKVAKILTGIVAIVVVIFGISYFFQQDQISNEKTKSENQKIKIVDLPIHQSLPFYLALEKGYFEQEGIDVERVRMGSPDQIVNALISGQVPFAASAATGIVGMVDFKNPDKLEIFMLTGGDDQSQNDAILVRKNSDINSISDLEGKKLGVLPSEQWRTIAKQILSKYNLDAERDVQLVNLAPGLQPTALQSGQIDALLAVQPVPTVAKVNGIGKELLSFATVKEIANPFYGGAAVVNAGFAQENPETTRKVIEVFDKAVKEIRQNPTSTKKYLEDYTAFSGEIINEVPLPLFKMHEEFDEKDLQATQDFYDVFQKHGLVEGKIDVKEVIYTSK